MTNGNIKFNVIFYGFVEIFFKLKIKLENVFWIYWIFNPMCHVLIRIFCKKSKVIKNFDPPPINESISRVNLVMF